MIGAREQAPGLAAARSDSPRKITPLAVEIPPGSPLGLARDRGVKAGWRGFQLAFTTMRSDEAACLRLAPDANMISIEIPDVRFTPAR